ADAQAAESRRIALRAMVENRTQELTRQGLDPVDAEAKAAAAVDKEVGQRGEIPPVRRTPWNQALPLLFAEMRVPCSEKKLRDYLLQVRKGAVKAADRVSIDLNRLDRGGFGAVLAEKLGQEFPDAIREILAAVQTRRTALTESLLG